MWAKTLALNTFERISKKRDNPIGKWNKTIKNSRNYSPMNVPMIDLNVCGELVRKKSQTKGLSGCGLRSAD